MMANPILNKITLLNREIEQLRAENSYLRRVGVDRISAEILALQAAALAELRAENERLRAENEHLRARLERLKAADRAACILIRDVSFWLRNSRQEVAKAQLAKWGDIRSASLKEPAL
jgi:cell division protein FtsB